MTKSAITRCAWPGIDDPLYAAYHDTEWGVPHVDEVRLFEKLILEGFQAGLSWLTILRKRDAFRAAFDGFQPETVAHYGQGDVARLMADTGIVRNRAKIEAAITSAQAYLKLRETTTLGAFLWGFADPLPASRAPVDHGELPAATVASKRMANGLKERGFRFVGPTTAYAFMQSTGMVNDHLARCHRYRPCAELRRAFTVPNR